MGNPIVVGIRSAIKAIIPRQPFRIEEQENDQFFG